MQSRQHHRISIKIVMCAISAVALATLSQLSVLVPHAQALSTVTQITSGEPQWYSVAESEGNQAFGISVDYSSETGYPQHLWRSDGTAAGTANIPGFTDISDFENVNGTIYFASQDTTYGRELWKIEPGQQTPQLVVDLVSGAGSSSPINLTAVGNDVYFTAKDGTNANAFLWKSDGTAAGTTVVKSSTPQQNVQISFITNVQGTVFFLAEDYPSGGYQLWKTDGSVAGTQYIKTLAGNNSARPGGFTAAGNKLFFYNRDQLNGTELWVSDGTADGTHMVRDISGTDLDTRFTTAFHAIGNTVYFGAKNLDLGGNQLWKSDGTAAGTTMLKAYDDSLNIYGVYNNQLIMQTTTHNTSGVGSGAQFWKSDGTVAGTVQFTNINPDGVGLRIGSGITPVAGKFYFMANDDEHGYELWESDATAQGTKLAADIAPGPTSSYPVPLAAVGQSLLFEGQFGQTGYQLARLDDVALVAPTNLTAVTPTNTAPILSWASVPSAANYRIYRDGVAIGTTTDLSFTDGIISASGGYTYQVAAVDGTTEGPKSQPFTVVYDSVPPSVGALNFSANPIVANTGSTVISASSTDNLSGVVRGEYYLDTDPGAGSGVPMTFAAGNLTTTVGNLPVGVYEVGVRAQDNAGNWSAVQKSFLVVENPSLKLSATGKSKRDLVPSVSRGDQLPGLTASTTSAADYGFNVGSKNGVLDNKNELRFSYTAGGHSFDFQSQAITWLTVDQSGSRVRYQGTGTVNVDGVVTPVLFTVDAVDGDKLSTPGSDTFELKIFANNANPATATPLYRASGAVSNNSGKAVDIDVKP